jgi:hypothetical protein
VLGFSLPECPFCKGIRFGLSCVACLAIMVVPRNQSAMFLDQHRTMPTCGLYVPLGSSDLFLGGSRCLKAPCSSWGYYCCHFNFVQLKPRREEAGKVSEGVQTLQREAAKSASCSLTGKGCGSTPLTWWESVHGSCRPKLIAQQALSLT